ncbi:MAG: leucine-rich repeat protein [Kiritimatiellae bacterium]|nr:leucine-rich repeat protein [Kiritimatiellia bacterium]
MKMTRKVLSSVVAALAAGALFAETEVVDGVEWTYQVKDGKAEIYNDWYVPAIPVETSGAIAIPATLGGCPVISIGFSAFYDCSSLTSVTIPDGVTRIGDYAFCGCSELADVTISESVTDIGECAFNVCSELARVSIPDGVMNIGELAFSYSGLADVTIGSGVTNIGYNAFRGCDGSFSVAAGNQSYKSVSGLLLTKDGKTLVYGGGVDVTIPNGVTNISDSAFYNCDNLTNVTISASVTRIGTYAFYGCGSLESVTMPDGVKSIESNAFGDCTGLRSVTIGNGVASIGYRAFYDCHNITSVTIPDSVTSIEDEAFFDCFCLKDVTIGSGVTNVGVMAFSSCGLVGSFSVAAGNQSYKSVSGLLLTKDGKTLVAGVCGDVTIPDGVTTIGSYAFHGANHLESVTMPDSVTTIGESAFDWCTNLKSVKMSNSVASIGAWAFDYCTQLENLTIPDSVTSIGQSAFRACIGLIDETSMPGVELVGGWAVGRDDELSGSLDLAGVRGIGDAVFEDSGLTGVKIPGSATRIGYRAFANCNGLASLTIGSGVKSIGEEAFVGCTGLASVTIPVSVTSIGWRAFCGCSELVSVKMPKIPDEDFFYECPKSLVITYWGDGCVLKLKSNNSKYGTVSGGGTFESGARVTIKATAKKGDVFAGWFADKSCKTPLNPPGYDNRDPKVKIVMPAEDTTIYAKFVTAASDKKSLKFSDATKKFKKTAVKVTAGSAFPKKIEFTSASLPTVTAKGFPKGLSIDKTTGEVTGVATVPGSYTATVTVKDAAGNTITQKVKISVSVPSWAKGTFCGLAYPGISGGLWAYLEFTVDKAGKVSGKVTYKGKSYSFKSSYESCSSSKAKFSPTVKIGSSTFKPKTVTVKKMKIGDLTLVEASNAAETFFAQKKAELVKAGKELAEIIGKKFTFTKKDANSGLKKTRDKLTVVISDNDGVKVSGTVNGKKLTAIVRPLIVSEMVTADGVKTYTMTVDIIEPDYKYDRTLVFTATVGPGGVAVNVEFEEE